MRSSGACIVGFIQLILGLFGCQTAVVAEDIRQFQLTGTWGEVSLRQVTDEQRYSGEQISRFVKSDIQEVEVNIQASAYVYHPNFLKLDFGGGPVLVRNKQASFDQSNPETQSQTVKEWTYNLNARLNFLEKKPYPFSLFFERRNPLIVSSVDEHFFQKNTKYGAVMSLREWELPLSLNMETYKLTSRANGYRQVIDDDISNVNLRMHQTNKGNGNRQLSIQLSRQISNSGNIGSGAGEIIGTDVRATSLNYEDYSMLGAQKQYTFKNIFSYIDRRFKRGFTSVTNLKQSRFSPVLHWNHSASARSYYQLDFLDNRQDNVKTENKALHAGYKKLEENRGAKTVELQIHENSTLGHNMNSYSVSGSTNTSRSYFQDRKKNPVDSKHEAKQVDTGKAVFRAAATYQVVDRESDQSSRTVEATNEEHVLRAEEVKLKYEHVETGTIEVWNINKTAQYTLTDYSVNVVGISAYIRRILGGNIADGETVIVDYRYNAGGTFSHTSFDQQLQVSMDWKNVLSMFAGINRSKIDITSGIPGIELVSSETRNLGFYLKHAVSTELTLGLDARIDRQKKGAAPHKRKTLAWYMQYRLFNSTFFRFSRNTVDVNYENDSGNVNLLRYNFTVSTRSFWRSNIYFSAVKEQDVGGEFPRELSDYILKWQWNYRRLYLSLNARSNDEVQIASFGEVKKDRRILRATLERRF